MKEFHLRRLLRAWGERLPGWRVVDLGCGGGLLSVPLAEVGADVLGVDLSEGSLRAARRAALARRLSCRFLRADLASVPLPDACADAVLLSDVLEHVPAPAAAVREAARLLRPGGRLYVNTFDRTLRARLLVVVLAERLGYVPRGTHDARLFVRPSELLALARAAGLDVAEVRGERVDVLGTLRRGSLCLRPARGTSVAYDAFFVRRLA